MLERLGKEKCVYLRKSGPGVCWSLWQRLQQVSGKDSSIPLGQLFTGQGATFLHTEAWAWGMLECAGMLSTMLTHREAEWLGYAFFLRTDKVDLGHAGVRGHAIEYFFAWKSAPQVC